MYVLDFLIEKFLLCEKKHNQFFQYHIYEDLSRLDIKSSRDFQCDPIAVSNCLVFYQLVLGLEVLLDYSH